MVEAMPEDTLRQSPMLLDLQRLLARQPFAREVRPAEGQREQRHQFAQPLGLGDVRLFEAEAARLQTREQRLDLPPPRVVLKQRLGLVRRTDDDVVAVTAPQPRDEQLLPQQPPCPLEQDGAAYALRAEEPTRLHALPAPVRDLGVGSHLDAERKALPAQVREPPQADELPVGAQVSNRGAPEEGDELFHQRDALARVRAALLRQDRPEQGAGHAAVGDAEHQHVQRRLAQIPVGAIHRDDPRGGHAKQPHDEASQLRVGQIEVAQEALNALVVRGRVRPAREHARHLREVDGLDLDDSDEEACEKVDARLVPSYILRQRPLQEAEVGHRCFLS